MALSQIQETMDKLNLTEILVIALLAFATYSAVQEQDYVAAGAIGIPGVMALTKAFDSTSTFGTDPSTQTTTFVSANFNGTEALTVAGIGFGAWRLYRAGAYTAAAAAAVGGVLLLFQAGQNTETF
jgi:hypothetical protein